MRKFIQAIQNGFYITADVFKYMKSHPKIIIPTVIIKVFYMGLIAVLYLQTSFFESLNSFFQSSDSRTLQFLLVYLGIVYFRFFEGLSALVTLHMVKQQYTTGAMSVTQGFKSMFLKSLFRGLSVILIWAALEMILKIVFALLKSVLSERLEKVTEGAERAANKGLRMAMLIAMPEIVWEKTGPLEAVKDGYGAFESKAGTIFSGIAIRFMFYSLMVVLSFLFLYVTISLGVFGWTAISIFLLFLVLIWSVDFLIEVLFSAKIYLWYSEWMRQRREAFKNRERLPAFEDIERPRLLPGYSDAIMDEKVGFKKDTAYDF